MFIALKEDKKKFYYYFRIGTKKFDEVSAKLRGEACINGLFFNQFLGIFCEDTNALILSEL